MAILFKFKIIKPRWVKKSFYPNFFSQKCKMLPFISTGRIWINIYFLWNFPFKGLCKHVKNWLLTPQGHDSWVTARGPIPWVTTPSGNWLASYHATGRFRKIRITRQKLYLIRNCGLKYFAPFRTCPYLNFKFVVLLTLFSRANC